MSNDLPDNQTTGALLTIDASVSSVLATASDRDWIRFVGESGASYWFHLNFDNGPDSSGEYMRLYSESGAPSTYRSGFSESVMIFTSTDEHKFIEVGNVNGFSSGPGKTYTLTAHLIDDAKANAATDREIMKGQAITDLFEEQGDRDWYRMDVTIGETYEILLRAINGGWNTNNLKIRNADGALITEFDQGGGDIGTLYEATASGTIYLDVGRQASATGSDDFGYRLSVNDPGDTIAQDPTTEAIVAIGGSTNIRIDYGGDRDWLGITLDAADYYRAFASAESYRIDTHMVVRNSAGEVIASDLESGFGVSESGSYFLDVGLSDISASDVEVSLAETDDVPGNLTSHDVLTLSQIYQGDWSGSRDVDFIGFDVVAGQNYRIDVSFTGDYFGKDFRVLRGDDTLQRVFPDTQKSAFFSHSADRDERLFLSLSDGQSGAGTYNVSFEQVAPDDIAGSSLTTATLAIGEIVSADIEYGADRDWFRFSAEAGIVYEVTMASIGAASVGVRELDGSEIAPASGSFDVSSTTYFGVDTDRDVFIDAGRYGQVDRSGNYTISARVSPDTVLGNISTLANILVDETIEGRTDHGRDFDFFRFEAQAGAQYAFVLQDMSGPIRPQLSVLDATGASTGFDAFESDAAAIVSYDADVTETLYLSAYAGSDSDYRLAVVDVSGDVSGSAETAVMLHVGNALDGTLEHGSDEDWFELDLVDGESYVAVLSGQDLLSGDVSIRARDGRVVESATIDSDDETVLSFAGEAELFLVVEGLSAASAREFSVTVNPEIEGAFQDQSSPLFTGLSTGLSIDGTVNAQGQRTITYNFAGVLDEFDNDGTTSFRADRNWTDYEEERIAATLNLYAETLNVEFVELSDTSATDLSFFAAELNGLFSQSVFSSEGQLGFAFLPLGGSLSGNVVFNVDGFGWDENEASGDTFDGGLEQFGFGAQTVLHEVGHALGLGHPFEADAFSTLFPGITDANGDGSADDVFNDAGSFELSQSAYTVMSYVDGWTEHPFGTGNIFLSQQFFGIPSNPGGHIGTPMALDIAVLQTIYGENQSTGASDDTYVLADTQAQTTGYGLIWDTGGTDTIHYSGARDVVLDLRAATLEVEDGGGGFMSFVNEALANDPVVGGFAIANGVVIEVAESGSGADSLTGNAAGNVLIAGGGNDTITGNAGNDTLTGDAGADLFVFADGSGDDTITDIDLASDKIDIVALELAFNQLAITDDVGGALVAYASPNSSGSILLQGVVAADVVEAAFVISPTAVGTSITGTSGNDTLTGSTLDEQFFGLAGDDSVLADAGNDLLEGDQDNDALFGGAGNDTLSGGDGADTLVAGTGNDTLAGGEGGVDDDILDYSDAAGPVSVTFSADEAGTVAQGADLDRFTEIERLSLSSFEDQLDASADTSGVSILAGDGRDDVLGGQAGDTLAGGADNDTLNGGAGNDTLEGGLGGDTIEGGLGVDTASYASSAAGVSIRLDTGTASGGDADGDDLASIENLTGSEQTDNLTGDSAANVLMGLDGDDQLNGGAGNDTLDGGLGNDRFFVDSVDDVVIEAAGEGTDLITTSVDFTLSENVENGSSSGLGNITITGNAAANFVTGNAGDNRLLGLAGADRLIGGEGDDTLEGGEGNDILQGQAGANRFVFSANNGNDQIIGWQASTDLLDFDALGLRFADLRLTSSGNEALITFDDPAGGTGSVRLIDIDPEVLEIGILADPGGIGSPGGIPLTAGTSGSDNLAATNGDDDVIGLAGNDVLNGRAGADTMLGGFGNDRYFLDQSGDQVIELEFQGTDQMDAAFSFTLADHVERGAVLGGGAVDITGNGLNNFITGSALSNVLLGADGRDRLIAFDGDDTLDGGLDNDVLEGGNGTDAFVFAADSGIDLITDFVIGEDVLDIQPLGIAFADMTIVDGPLGALVIFDLAPGSVDLVQLQGISAADLRLASFLTVFGDNQPPILGTPENDVLLGTVENDELQGLGGADLIDGRDGADTMFGGDGDDRYFINDADDVVVELLGEGTDLASTSISFTLPEHVENGSALGIGSLDLTGNAEANALTGNEGNNVLIGLAGNDNLQGNDGNDTIDGGTGADLLRGGADADVFRFQTGDASAGADQIIDFEIDLDTIDLSATGLVFGDLTIQDVGSNASITFGTDTITVLNTSAALLTESQFDFVI